MKKIAVIVALFLALLLVFLLFNRDAGNQPAETVNAPSESAPPVFMEQPHQGLATVHCALEVNGARYRTLGSGVPLYVKVIITNPLSDRDLDLGGTEHLIPGFRNRQGDPVNPGLQLVTPAAESAPPGGVAVLTWAISSPLPPGEYTIGLEPPTHLADRTGIDRVRVKAALLQLTAEPAPDAEIAYYTRQIMAARGEDGEIIRQVREELTNAPDDLALHRELLDALERTGDFAGAREELIELGMLAQERQPHLPAWIITRDRMLQEKIAAHGS